MNLWDRHLFKKLIFLYVWVSIAVFSVYFCSDLLFKFKDFKNGIPEITLFYSYKMVPYFIISMPVIAFITQILLILSLHRKFEWHSAKLLCISNFKLCRSIILIGLLLCLNWIIAREIIFPLLQNSHVNSSYQLKTEYHDPFIFTSNKYTFFLQKIKKDSENFNVLKINTLKGELTNETIHSVNNVWVVSKSNLIYEDTETLPTIDRLNSLSNKYIYDSMYTLLKYYNENKSLFLLHSIYERVIFPLSFIYLFTLSSFAILRCRNLYHVWIFPTLSFLIFSVICMTFKTFSSRTNTNLGFAYWITLILVAHLFYIQYFKRRTIIKG